MARKREVIYDGPTRLGLIEGRVKVVKIQLDSDEPPSEKEMRQLIRADEHEVGTSTSAGWSRSFEEGWEEVFGKGRAN